jgi:molybdate transport system permease protein
LTSHAKEPLLDFWQLSSEEWSAVWLSLRVACVATLATLPVAVALGYGLARRQFWGKSLLETVLNLPLVLPPVVVGYLLLVEFGRNGWLGSRLVDWFGIRFVFDWKGAVAASAVMAFPLVVRSIRVAMATIDPRLEEAARTLGCGRFETFLRITVPLARRGIIAGAVLGFARSIGEFGATIMIAGSIPGQTQTIPLKIYSLLNSPGGAARASRLVVVSVLIAVVALAASEWFERRGRFGVAIAGRATP